MLALILVMEGEFHVEAICFFQIVTVLTCLVSRERKRVRWTRKILSSRPKLGKRTQGFFHTEIINHRVLNNMTAKWLKKKKHDCLFCQNLEASEDIASIEDRKNLAMLLACTFKSEVPYLLTDFSRNKQ